MKRIFYFIVAFLCVSINSCHNDDIPNIEDGIKGQTNSPDSEVNEEDVTIPESVRKELVVHEMLAKFCHVDTINDSTFSYRAKYGHQDETVPSTYLFKSQNEKEAYSFFKYLIPTDEREKIYRDGNSFVYSIDQDRVLKYTDISSADMEAMIEFDFPEIPEIKKYVYIPTDLWPYNDASSPFSLGSVWKHIDNSQTVAKYVCVKEYAGKNDPGILMTFDKGGREISVGACYNNVPFLVDCASKWAWQKLEDLYVDYPMMFDDAVKEGAIPKTLINGYKYTVGGVEVYEWTTGWWFWKKKHHKCTVHNVWIQGDEFKFEDFSWEGTLTSRCNMRGSSHIEFGKDKPAGRWEQISF